MIGCNSALIKSKSYFSYTTPQLAETDPSAKNNYQSLELVKVSSFQACIEEPNQ
jgi:hypothetical protein